MVSLVIWLFIETQRAVERERRAKGIVTHTLWQERRTYTTISIFFALSYICRYVFNLYISDCGQGIDSFFAIFMIELIIYLLEGASMGVLMMFHMKNFT